MLRYRLDELGAFQFEWLVQSLLKSVIAPGIESWGDRGDHGRDAFARGPLSFPDRSNRSDGPFIFQVKFVENANAAGADPSKALRHALGKEKERIVRRMQAGFWETPRHYVLVTNVVPKPALRLLVEKYLAEFLGTAACHFLSGADICDFLDHEPAIRQSFPQVLGLRDLRDLIQDAINKEDIERSRAAIDCAADVAPVFVPTRAYQKAWRVLSEHRFVVLEGPAETGKSAIAWMIALAQVANGWQAIYCRDPDVFFSQHDPSRRQIFVADDAFGLTEYDPARSQKWEKELALVTRRLDARHWLVWTSRKHILERALKRLDFRRDSPNFPDATAVVVSAEDLTPVEKALILYRHAKKSDFNPAVRGVVRQKAMSIVGNPHFTPERIRKLVKEVLPKYNQRNSLSEVDLGNLEREMHDVIVNPTERTKTTFRALPPGHKWALIAMLEVGLTPTLKETSESYSRLCPEQDQEPFEDVLDQLTESFIKRTRQPALSGDGPTEILSWIHPSYRDLVIDELMREASLSNRFLSYTHLAGITLAISTGGGRHGERELPFLTSERAWQLLGDRCRHVAMTVEESELPDFLKTLASAMTEVRAADAKDRFHRLTRDICDVVRERWDDSCRALTADELEAYEQASLLLSPLPPAPDLRASWTKAADGFLAEVKWGEEHNYFFPSDSDEFLKLVNAIGRIEPRLLRQNQFPENFRSQFEKVFQLARSGADLDLSDDAEGLRSDSYRLKQLRDLVEEISVIVPELDPRKDSLLDKLESKASEAATAADELEESEPYDPDEGRGSNDDSRVDLQQIFSDL